jgi:hypothetical protein
LRTLLDLLGAISAFIPIGDGKMHEARALTGIKALSGAHR